MVVGRLIYYDIMMILGGDLSAKRWVFKMNNEVYELIKRSIGEIAFQSLSGSFKLNINCIRLAEYNMNKTIENGNIVVRKNELYLTSDKKIIEV